MSTTKPFMTTKEAAAYLNITTRHFWRLVQIHDVKPQKITARCYVWPLKEVKRIALRREL